MTELDPGQAFAERKQRLSSALAEIRRKMEGLMAENQRLSEVVRMAESELRNRRDQVQQLENDILDLKDKRKMARAGVEHAMERLDRLIVQPHGADS